jgi:hypothetical protein
MVSALGSSIGRLEYLWKAACTGSGLAPTLTTTDCCSRQSLAHETNAEPKGTNKVIKKRFVIPALLWLAAAAATAATPPAPPQAKPAETAAHTPSIKETLTAVNQIAHELKLIDARLGKLEQSLAGVDASLKPVGAIAEPAALRQLILLAEACGAGLIVLHALLRRWSSRAVAPAARMA